MSGNFRHFIAALFMGSLCCPALAEPDPRPGLSDFLSLERLNQAVAQQLILLLRTQTEFEYEFMSANPLLGEVTLSGVTLRPEVYAGSRSEGLGCDISMDRVTISGQYGAMAETSPMQLAVNMIGVRMNKFCLLSDLSFVMSRLDIHQIVMDHASLRLAYDFPKGEIDADLTVAVNGIGNAEMALNFVVLPRTGIFGGSRPAFRVTKGMVALENRAGPETASEILGKVLWTDPENVKDIIVKRLEQVIGWDYIGKASRSVDQIAKQLDPFLAGESEMIIEANLPAGGVIIEQEAWEEKPASVVALLNLQVGTVPVVRERFLDADALADISDPTDLTPARRIELGRALLEGAGVPQAPALVPDMLEPALDDDDYRAEAALLTALAIAETDPKKSYKLARRAAAYGKREAVPLMDRLETRISTLTVLDLDYADDLDFLPEIIEFAPAVDPRSLRAIALAHMTGAGELRSYPTAYYFASLAEAAGDVGAAALKQEINARFANRGAEVEAAWADWQSEVQKALVRHWIAFNWAERYRAP